MFKFNISVGINLCLPKSKKTFEIQNSMETIISFESSHSEAKKKTPALPKKTTGLQPLEFNTRIFFSRQKYQVSFPFPEYDLINSRTSGEPRHCAKVCSTGSFSFFEMLLR